MTGLAEFIELTLAVYAVSVWLTTKHGPFGLFEIGREWGLRRRGYRFYTITQLQERMPAPVASTLAGDNGGAWLRDAGGEWHLLGKDWIAAGLTCPACASMWVALVAVIALGLPLLSVLSLSGGAMAVVYATGSWSKVVGGVR